MNEALGQLHNECLSRAARYRARAAGHHAQAAKEIPGRKGQLREEGFAMTETIRANDMLGIAVRIEAILGYEEPQWPHFEPEGSPVTAPLGASA